MERQQAKFMLPPDVRKAIRQVAADLNLEQSQIVEAALRRNPKIKAKLNGGSRR